ncbi:hypothetical protein SAMN04488038_102289 [Solimonas aquatica]|uniref:Uncharacterized protein n=1 Tax=Solimonas aquatica TaxID=489703 RepID=A0A1H9BZQ0_9GAMM|nr:hypothetical protein [Solimonas aquatica]SEP94221.1 hypothetical protein SAMN04488038_102289 [Solimonas aquatica]
MNFSQLEKTFESTLISGPPRRAGARLFQARPHHLWCPRCCRVFPNGVYRLVAERHCCPYRGCDAEEHEARAWSEVRRDHPYYAEYPQLWVRFPASLAQSAA